MKLRTKIVLEVIILSLCINTIFLFVFISDKRKDGLFRLDQKIKNTGILLNQVISGPLYDTDISKLETNLKSFLNDAEIVSISLKELNGNINIHFEDGELNKKNLIKKDTIIFYNKEKIGTITTLYSTSCLDQQLFKSITQMLVSFIFLTFIVSLALYFLLKKITQPITDLTILSSEIAQGNLETEIKIVSQDEIGILSQSLITMRDSIKQKIQSLKLENKERILAEKAAKESEKKYRYLFEFSIDAILLSDPEKGYLDCNPAAFELFGIESKEQLMQLTSADLSPQYQPDGTLSSEKAGKMIEKVLKTGSNLFEWAHRNLNGEEFYASVLLTRVQISDQIILQATIRDISDYKRAQEMMIQSEKMLSVGGLAAGMAHEINNPLAGIMQTADVMATRLSKIDMPANVKAAKKIGVQLEDIKTFMEARDILRMSNTIKEAGKRIANIVENMLSFARKSEDTHSSHDLSQLLDNILELASTDYDLKKQYDFKTIEIIKEYEDHLPMISCEGEKIQQVLLNVLRNGAQAMQEAMQKNDEYNNPKFTLRLYRKIDADMLCIEIEDNGPGMDEATRKRVFEPFFTTKPVGVGTGLGLSVSYFIITENHNGKMSVESTPGSGAKFIIRLPLEKKKGAHS